ncbi:MAG TPA: (2Fe-2S)-binding protein [Gemmataceae bacterium]|jgi:NAD(P)H-nitrite reductase large subunit|nr:(2Fe-2S)-binding protein [Gemmataceae bacterium]
MDLDAEVCYCFHVSRRKLENFVRRTKPQVPSRLSECGGAGTGCGWCIPFLKRLFRATSEEIAEIDRLTPEEYAAQRAEYIRDGHGVPAPGATPLPQRKDEG